MKYALSKNAERDLRDIWDYTVETWGQVQAERYLNKLEARFLDLAKHPKKGRARDDLVPDYRSYQEGKHVIFFKQIEVGIAIARILHERMDVFVRLEEDPEKE